MAPAGQGSAPWSGIAARALPLAALVVLAALLQGASVNVSDPDAFYHLRHAWVYRVYGPFESAFPWTWFSVVRLEASDLWYGFHILLVPFSLAPRPLDGLLAAGVCVTAAALALVFAALTRLQVRWPLAWTLAFAFSSADVLFRLTMVRPQPLSLGLALLALPYAAAEAPGPRERRALALLSLAAAWLHLALAWLVPLVATTTLAVRFALAGRRKGGGSLLLAALGGAAAGALLRPHPSGALRLVRVQVVTLLGLKRLGVSLPFGTELFPLPPLEAAQLFAVPSAAAALLLLAWAAARRRGAVLAPAPRVAAAAAVLLAAGFAVLTVTVASRSQELAAAFGTAGAAIVFTGVLSVASRPLRSAQVGLLAATLLALPFAAASRFAASASYRGRPPAAFARAALWLSAHARPGDLVFHLWWDQFPHLFFWNPGVRYVNGMDPVFAYAFDPALFWKAQGLAGETTPGATCGLPRCGPGDLEPAARVLRRDFGARYVVLHLGVSARTDAKLATDASFRLVFDDGTDVVYEILPEPRGDAPEYDPLRSPVPRR